jgi:D-aspartate ligase
MPVTGPLRNRGKPLNFHNIGKTGALILGGAHGSLAVVRSLGRRGIPVWHLTDGNLLSRFSRYTTHSARWLGPAHPAALRFLLDYCESQGLDGWVLIPGGDSEVRFLAENHAALSPRYKLITEPWETIAPLYDKRRMYAEAERLGLSVPKAYSAAEVLCGKGGAVCFPLVIKPATREASNPLTRAKAWRVNDAPELAVRLREATAMMGGPDGVVLQELIPGGGEQQYSYAAIWNNGAPIVSLTARRTRQFPVDFGFTSTFVETVEDPGIRADAERLLAAAAYHGLVEIEFKRDEREGRFKILDINTRIWTWIGLGERAGVDFPYLAWCVALGLPVEAGAARPGIAWTHLSRDLVAALQEVATGRLPLRNYLRSLAMPRISAAFAGDDWLPGLLDLPLLVPRLIRRWTSSRASCTDETKPLPKPFFQGERHGFRQTGGR